MLIHLYVHSLSEVHLQHICFRLAFTKCLHAELKIGIDFVAIFGSQLGKDKTLNFMLVSGHMSNANALYDLTNLALWSGQFQTLSVGQMIKE